MKKTFRKFLSLLIAFCIVMAAVVLPSAIMPVAAYSGGVGSSASPYLISSADDLLSWATAASGGERYANQYLALTTDIDLTGKTFNGIAGFRGTFDGRGHEISGIDITATGANSGFFQYFGGGGYGATVKNLTLTGALTSSYQTAAGFAGYADGGANIVFDNCVNKVNVTATGVVAGFLASSASLASITMKSCVNNGDITSTSAPASATELHTAGFIAYASKNVASITIIGSQNNGTISNASINAVNMAGFIAKCLSPSVTINSCINSGTVKGGSTLGGIIARNDGGSNSPVVTISNTINIGTVKTVRTSGTASAAAIFGLYTSAAGTINASTAYYRVADVDFSAGAGNAQNTEPKGTAMNTPSDWTNGTVAGLLGPLFKQGASAPELYTLEGAGTQAAPYEISCAADLDYLSAVVNNNITDYQGKYLKQTATITYNTGSSDYQNWNASAPANTFTRIGYYGRFFRGNYDGGDYTIYGLYINGGDATTGTGFFGAAHNNQISNLHIKNSYVTAYTSIGGIVGYSQGATFTNCSFEGVVYSTNTAPSNGMAGGIIGNAVQDNTINKCYTSGKISSYEYSGGLIGKVANSNNRISNSYSIALVDAVGAAGSLGRANGGLVGLVQFNSGTPLTITNSFYYNSSFPYSATEADYRQHIIGWIYSGTATVTNTAYLASSADISGRGTNYSASDFSDGTVLDVINGESAFVQGVRYPLFYSASDWDGSASSGFSGGTGTESDPYLISCAPELQYFANQVNGGTDYSGKFIKLTADIDLNDISFTPIGTTTSDRYFRGTFDGDNHSVKGLNISSSSTGGIGFFGACHNNTVKNLNVRGNVVATTGNSPVAGIAGVATGFTLTNCSFDGTVSSSNADSTSGNAYSASGLISSVTGWITVDRCYVSGTIDGYGRGGGLIGAVVAGSNFNVTLTNSYCDAEVTGRGLAYTGSNYTSGGLIGYLQTATIRVTDCFFYGTAPAKRNTGMAGPVINNKASGTLTLLRVYYNSDNASLGAGASYNSDDGIGKTSAAFADGTVTALLNSSGKVFIQGTEHPIFDTFYGGHSLVLDDYIGVSFFVNLSGLTDAEIMSSYMTFEITKGNGEPVAGVQCDFADIDEQLRDYDKNKYGFTCRITSVQMAEDITPTLHYTSGGVDKTAVGAAYSATDYIDFVNGHPSYYTDGAWNLARAVGNYGYYAQKYFTDVTATAMSSSYKTVSDYSAFYSSYKTKLADYEHVNDKSVYQFNLNYSTNTVILTRVSGTFNVEFNTVTVLGENYGKIKRNFHTVKGVNVVDLQIALPIMRLGDKFTITGTKNGTEFTVTDLSALSYVYGILAKYDETANGIELRNLVCALYDYYSVATSYVYGIDVELDGDEWL